MFKENIINPLVENILKSSNSNAFCINEKFYTYREFGEAISGIRTLLKRAKFSNRNVGLVINDDLSTYASIFALWMDGCAYVPLHPNWPIERCQEIINQVKLDLILDSSEITRYEGNIIDTMQYPKDQINLECNKGESDDEIAYILFTSGSTGKPKGVMISRNNVGAFMDSSWKTGILIDEKDRCLQCFDLSFDVSVQSYLVPLTKGACCYTVPNGQIKYVYAAGLIENHKLTFGAMAPSMIRFLKPYFDEIDMSSLKTSILTAEASPLDLVEQWQKVAMNADIYDFYGPTEATIYCTCYKLNSGGNNKALNGMVSIGRGMHNVKTIIIDDGKKLLSIGEKGELCVAGPQLSLGYFQNLQKNSEAFFDMVYDGELTRFYHTGDLCYMDEDGDIMYSGRIDHQAKIQGYRVEMGEIENHAREFIGDINVVCMPYENKAGITEIAMFIESAPFPTDDLKSFLKSKMPQYMIPHHIQFEQVFPINGNAKIDKVALKSNLKLK